MTEARLTNPGRSKATARQPRIRAEVGPYRIRLNESFAGDPYRLAVDAVPAPDDNQASYAAVCGDGTAVIGSITTTHSSRLGALLTGLRHGLRLFADQTQVKILLSESTLRPLLITAGSLNSELSADRIRILPYRDVADRLCGHLRRIKATFEELPSEDLIGEQVPQHPLLGLATRLSLYTQQVTLEHLGFDHRVLTCISTAMSGENSIHDFRLQLLAASKVDDPLPDTRPETTALQTPEHTLTDTEFDALAAGCGGPAEIERLAEFQLTITRVLVASIPRTGPAWDVLTEVDQSAPKHLQTVLAHPYVRAWAVACARGEADPRHLAAIAAATAVRAGLDADLELPVCDGHVHLPTVGGCRVSPAESITIRIRRGAFSLPGAGAWRLTPTLHAGDVTIALEDTDPYRDCHEWPAAPPLDEDEILAWRERFDEAWALIERDHPAYAPGLAAGLSTIVPLRPAAPGSDVSSTARHAFGAVAIALPADPATLALLLIHEYQHVKLGAVLDLFDLYDSDDTDLYYAPWRDDPRPLEGLLQGTYAHIAVADFWRARRLADPGDEAAAAFARWRWQTAEAIDTLAASGSLTPLGERFAAGMRATVRPWLDEPVPDAARSAAERSARRHRKAWPGPNPEIAPSEGPDRPQARPKKETTMAQLTDTERAKICELYSQHHLTPQQIADSAGVNRQIEAVRSVLVQEGTMKAPRPRNIDDAEMEAIKTAYLAHKSIRECAEKYGRGYGVIRAVLVYKDVELRPRGGSVARP